jgi:hypothetical protein
MMSGEYDDLLLCEDCGPRGLKEQLLGRGYKNTAMTPWLPFQNWICERVPDVLILINHVLLQKPQGADAPSAARTPVVHLKQMRWAMKALHPP